MATGKNNCYKHLRLASRDNSVVGDELGEDTPQRLDSEGQRRDVQKQDILDVPLQHAALDRKSVV